MRFNFKLIFLVIMIFSFCDLNAQEDKKKRIIASDKKARLNRLHGNRSSNGPKQFLPYGGLFTPKGNIHALFIFVGIEDTIQTSNGEVIFNHQNYANWNILNGQSLPNYIDPETGGNGLFYSSESEFSKERNKDNRGISEYFYQMSLGQFRFTGEVLKDPESKKPVRIDIKPKASQSIRELTYLAMDEFYRRFPNFDWARFDQRQNYPNYKFDNSSTEPDGKPDCIVFIYRSHKGMKQQVFDGYRIGWGGGIATSYLSGYKSKWPGISFDNAGYTSSNESAKDVEQLRSFFLHEVGHKLYAAPHYNGANGEIGDYFFFPSNAYGMMNTSGLLNTAANGWERWVCGWIDIEDAVGKSSDLNEDFELKGTHTFFLDDFVSTGQAVRIKIPFTENQYLWIENHQNKSTFDEGLSAGKVLSRGGEQVPYAEKGVYMYVERISGELTTIPRYGKRSDSNGLKLLHADGNWDYTFDNKGTKDWGDYYNNPIYIFKRLRENPIGGINPFMRYLDDFSSIPFKVNSKDGKMKYKNTVHGGYIESVSILKEAKGDDSFMLYSNFGGRNKEAIEIFKRRSPFFQSGDEVSLSGQVCLVNLRRYNSKKGEQSPFIPNGVTIKVLDDSVEGRVEICIEFGDFEIREDKRWTGNIAIQKNYIDSMLPGLILAKGKCLLIDKSGTPNRHLITENKDFISESKFQLDENVIFVLEGDSKLILKDNSRFVLHKNAKLILKKGAKIIIYDSAKILIETGAEIIYEKGAKLIFKGEASQIEKLQ